MEPYLADLVIVNYNARKYLPQCLKSIREFSGAASSYRVWVIDNASQDGSAAYIKSLTGIQPILNRTNRGYGAACNQGLLRGQGRYQVLLNSDTQVTPGWLPPLIRIFQDDPRAAVVGPRLVTPDGFIAGAGVVGTYTRPVIRGWGEPDEAWRYNEIMEVISVSGCCMMLRRDLLPVLGLFDEGYFHYFEETDYCLRARLQGFKVIYCPGSVVAHHLNGSLRNRNKLAGYYRAAQKRFYQKWETILKEEREDL
ncbi:MAG: glycosyltransferase family 2 protein [Firmicutes bacterium]|nr:glycosyltransferase family 2 protein [Bacillota bacterium]